MTTEDQKIGMKVLEARLEAGMTRAEIAKYLNISHQQFEKYEKGMNRVSVKSLFVLSKIFEKPLSWFTEYLEDEDSDESYRYKNNFAVRINRELRSIKNEESQEKLIKMIRFFIKEGM